MSSLKRKGAPAPGSTTKAAKPAGDPRPSKRAKPDKISRLDEKTRSKLDTDKNENAKPHHAPLISRLKEEEPMFPRGGGSILSPLEQKQIQIQAKNDVLFEQESAPGEKAEKNLKSKKRKSIQGDNGHKKKLASDEDAVKIESLNYKRLVKGSLVLGQVCDIRPLEIAVALPNNLVGHVSITAVSDALTKRLESEVEDVEDDDDESVSNDLDLNGLFAIGQYVRAYVKSTIEDTSALLGRSKKHIDLSLRPEDANQGLSSDDVVPNCTVMASVASVEDHGYVMELGLETPGLRGFLQKKQLDPSIPDELMQPGAVRLCVVSDKKANGKIVQLSTLSSKLGDVKNIPSEATTINTFLPGTAVDVLVSQVTSRGLAGKVLGHLDVTADLIHSGIGPDGIDLEKQYKVGSKLKARVICNFPAAKEPKLGLSLLPHVAGLRQKQATGKDKDKHPLQLCPISTIIDLCTVRSVEPAIGVYCDIGVKGLTGFVHISRLKDGKLDALFESSGPFKVGSTHKGRVVGYNLLDGLFLLSFEQHVIEQPYLRVEDVPVGEVVSGTVEKLIIGSEGVSSMLIKLADGITGLVSEAHFSDTPLKGPEKKFREGTKVKARVLSTNISRGHIRLTLKRALVFSEAKPIKDHSEVALGMRVPGTIVKLLQNGAIMQFYGSLRGFLPVSEMSEAYIHDPKEHFRVGQAMDVHVIDVDTEAKKLIVTCKDPAAFGLEKQMALKELKLGDIVSGKVTQKTEHDVFIELSGSSLKAMLPVGQLTDKSTSKTQSALKKIYVGQTLSELMVLDKHEGRRSIILTQKPSLLKASKENRLLVNIDHVKAGQVVQGFVRNITATSVFVQFAGNLVALLPKSQLPEDAQKEEEFGMHRLQSVTVQITSIDRQHGRLVVAIPSAKLQEKFDQQKSATKPVINALDSNISSIEDVFVGMVTKARVVAIKETQLNVELADNIQGRIDMSQVFDSWDQIQDPKAPLHRFYKHQVVRVRVLGIHDARNHRFLPITHRSMNQVLELSAKPSDLKDAPTEPLSFDKLEVGMSCLAFVNNIGTNCLWVNLSPTVRGRINVMDTSDDLSQVNDFSRNFPVGTVLRVRVKAVDAAQGRLDLTARSEMAESMTWDSVKKNQVLVGRITKTSDRQILVHLSDVVSGPVHKIDLSDDYDEAKPLQHAKNDAVRVSVVDIDRSNKKMRLSTRHSRTLNSGLPIKDREITSISQLQKGDLIRGFVKNVSDKGVFVALGGDVTAYVRISDLSDRFLKDWKADFQIDQLVKGRVTKVDVPGGWVSMTLKASAVDGDYTPTVAYADLKQGAIVTGRVRKVEEFGAFIVVENSDNVSGLCHRSEMADKPVSDARKLYKEGDVVKALVLKIEAGKRRMSLGLKPSYFDGSDDEMDVDGEGGAALDSDSASDEGDDDDRDIEDADGDLVITGTDNISLGSEDEGDEDADVEMTDKKEDGAGGLDAGGFDWSGAALDLTDNDSDAADDVANEPTEQKKKRRKAEIPVDRTAELDVNGPQSASDFERLLLGQPNSSQLWIAYMAFQMQVSELAKAREVAERAIQTINMREETEKLNVWIAHLNLEVAYGTDETLEEVFKRACQYNEEQEVYERLTSIYIQSGKHDKADDLFQALVKKFGFESPQVWTNYAHFLFTSVAAPERARALLPRAMKTLEQHHAVALTRKFAALEFRTPTGDAERGRTLFEGLLAAWPKKSDLWIQLLDLEVAAGSDAAVIRDVFERGARVKGLKARPAKHWFQRWAAWEEKNGDAKSRERVTARSREWVAAAEARKTEGAAAGTDNE